MHFVSINRSLATRRGSKMVEVIKAANIRVE